MKKSVGLALILTIVACGKAKDDELPASDLPPDATSQTVAVRLLGVRAEGPVRVQLATLELTVDGAPISARMGTRDLDLGNDQNAWAVTTFDLPVEARKVAIRLKLHPDGVIERNGRSQLLDLSGPPVSIIADAAQIRKRNKVVVEIDIARSLVERGEQLFLLPEFIVRY
ncbi:hypothetical protein SAMN05443572_102876 [Myxococcus fulvus]|uniref:Lipoprotein n=1 Tax=Myxococcus fulvus TaxID=33 RepID=A0A511SWT7_MYXFU|nr:hypothetical protein [Myxococcus fulvus]AKF86904.1 hypothetical protein MFUL124B02_35610 [Myxococcus fulvus 124B02]GEN06007.1 hypothetical protein MFU01_10440 [Myxococcus fulvus]SET61008.1 hypothetical protein SAMN05443572_102876 [Myxococcus fulvus]